MSDKVNEYLAYLDKAVEQGEKLMRFGEWMRVKDLIRYCHCGGTIATSTNRCSICSIPEDCY